MGHLNSGHSWDSTSSFTNYWHINWFMLVAQLSTEFKACCYCWAIFISLLHNITVEGVTVVWNWGRGVVNLCLPLIYPMTVSVISKCSVIGMATAILAFHLCHPHCLNLLVNWSHALGPKPSVSEKTKTQYSTCTNTASQEESLTSFYLHVASMSSGPSLLKDLAALKWTAGSPLPTTLPKAWLEGRKDTQDHGYLQGHSLLKRCLEQYRWFLILCHINTTDCFVKESKRRSDGFMLPCWRT